MADGKRRGAPQRSVYRKIQIALAEARREESASAAELVERIARRGYVDFTRYRADEDGTVTLVGCSRQAIQRVVELCGALDLLDLRSGVLTPAGLKAAGPGDFAMALREALLGAMERLGAPLAGVQQASAELLKAVDEKQLPTWTTLAEKLGIDVREDQDQFRTYLTLLAQAGGIGVQQRKLYLPWL